MLISFNCNSKWILTNSLLDEKGNKVGGIYYNDEGIRTTENKRIFFWRLMSWDNEDQKLRGKLTYKSISYYIEQDCIDSRFRTIYHGWYKEPEGKNFIEGMESTNKEWTYLPPDAPGLKFINYMCNYHFPD